jgi:hypothetical protein
MQQQPFTGTQTASVPIFQPSRGRQQKMAAAKISNINESLTQNQKQELRVNTGKDFRFLAGVPIKRSGMAASKQRAE